MKNSCAKGIVTGVVLTALICAALPVLAETGRKNIQVDCGNIKIYLHGAEKTPSQEPFIYEGSTYVPLRFVAEALGETVEWDGDANAIYIGAKPSAAASESPDIYSGIAGSFPYPAASDGTPIPYDDYEKVEYDPAEELFEGHIYAYNTPTLGQEGIDMGVDPLTYLIGGYIEQLEEAGFTKAGDETVGGNWLKGPLGVAFAYDEIERMTYIYMYHIQ